MSDEAPTFENAPPISVMGGPREPDPAPMLRALRSILGPHPYLVYMDTFRYPLAGEVALDLDIIRRVRIPCDWALEIGLLQFLCGDVRGELHHLDRLARFIHHRVVAGLEPDRAAVARHAAEAAGETLVGVHGGLAVAGRQPGRALAVDGQHAAVEAGAISADRFHNYHRIAQFAQRDGIEIPRWVLLKMEGYLDDTASIRAFGLDIVTELCERLLKGGAPGLHFYCMNQSALTTEICRRLGLAP